VKRQIIDISGSERWTDLHARYMKFRNDEEVYNCQYLCEKLLKEFPGQLKTIKRSKKEGNVLCHYNLDENEAYVKASN
jgi:hypothetical protein